MIWLWILLGIIVGVALLSFSKNNDGRFRLRVVVSGVVGSVLGAALALILKIPIIDGFGFVVFVITLLLTIFILGFINRARNNLF